MPKILEHGDGSKPTVYIIWPHLATPISAMKRSVRPLFGILLFAVLALTISCQIFDRHYFSFQLETNLVPSPVFNSTPPELNSTQPEFNSTLLEFASVDIGEEKSKQEVEQLLEANFVNQGRATWRRFNHQDVRDRATTRLQVVLRSPKFYRYWLDFRRNLNAWFRKKRFQPDIMMDLVKLVKLPIDRHNGLSLKSDDHTRYKSCAVVGNSGILLKSEYGELIDSHEFVIRLNNAMIERYESKVGSKTSLSFINSNILHPCARREGCYCHPYGVNVPIIMYICQPVHFLDYTVCNVSHKAPLLVTDSRFDMLCARIVKYYSAKRFVEVMNKSLGEWDSAHDAPMFHYSSGMQAITLALGICDEVSVFGFGKSTSAKHHYHTNQQAELHLHDYEAEYDFYHDLVENPRAIPFISDRFKFPPVVIYH